MSESWEKGQKPLELPNPELNPLQNPTLGRNLGRWAQVYFTSPPEKREQAVVDLLRELRTEAEPEAPRLDESRQIANPVIPGRFCGVCQQPNELDQKFCGLCGSPLTSPGQFEPPPRVAEIASEGPVAAPASPSTTEAEDLQWLREKSLSRLSDSDEPSGRWKYIVIVLVLVAAGFGVLQWVSQRPAAEQSQPVVSSAPPPEKVQPAQPMTVSPSPAVTQSAPQTTKQPRVEASAATENQIHSARVTTNAASRQTAPVEPLPAQTASSPEGGTQELYLAQGYLGGKHGMRDSAEAAKWLWKAVAKQNTTADVLLADLYISGDGVAKSCDQARLLLSAAAQKGQPSATEKLRQLESGGCR